jgi:hypothetical protein
MDDRHAFVSVEGTGAQPGTMDVRDVMDLNTLTKVASIDLGQQAGGMDFWRSRAVAGSRASACDQIVHAP